MYLIKDCPSDPFTVSELFSYEIQMYFPKKAGYLLSEQGILRKMTDGNGHFYE